MNKILLVDDDEDFLFIIREYLESYGLETDTAESAMQARKRLAHSRYVLVISDFNMPGESGLDLFRSVSSRYPDLCFVLMTGSADPRLRREAFSMGVAEFVEKPFSLVDLKRIIACAARCRTRSRIPAPAA